MALVVGDARGRRGTADGAGGPPGAWSIGASMALAAAASLAARGWDPDDMTARFLRCRRAGEESADGRVAEIGPATDASLARLEFGSRFHEAAERGARAAGCGALPRIAPVALHAARVDREEALLRCRDACAWTHDHERAVTCAGAFGLVLRGLLAGAPVEAAAADALEALEGWSTGPDRERLARVLAGEPDAPPTAVEPADVALAAAIRCAADHAGVAGPIEAARARGGRAEVVAAVAGALAGTREGLAEVPEPWVAALPRADHVVGRARALARAAAEGGGEVRGG